MRKFLTVLKEFGRYSHYSIIPSSYRHYLGERTKFPFFVSNIGWKGSREGTKWHDFFLVSFFRSLGAKALLMVNLGFHEQK